MMSKLRCSRLLSLLRPAPRVTPAVAALFAALLVALLAPTPVVAASESPYGWFRYGLPADRDRPPPSPTRDQTSLFGLEASIGEMTRKVARRADGERFEFDVESRRLILQATLRPVRPLELFGLIGQADLDSPSEDADFDGRFGLAYGGGARLSLVREREPYDTTFFVQAQYLQFESEAADVRSAAPTPTVVLRDEVLRWREWEGRAGVSWRLPYLRPYLGLRYSDAEADIIHTRATGGARPRLRATERAGGFVGLTMFFGPRGRIGLGAEVGLVDQLTGQVALRAWF